MDSEKNDITRIEGSKDGSILAAMSEEHSKGSTALDQSAIEKARILRKLDIRIIPIMTVLYLFSFLDRGNIGNARILGMQEDLHLTRNQYQMVLTVFFFTYSFFELPSNVLLKKLRPSIWLPGIMVAWGIVTICFGFVQNYHGLLIARIFLGITEAGLFPGVAYYLTLWYPAEDLAFRQGMFYSGGSAAGAFSGLLAYAINKMDGLGGYTGWRWIFLIEGAATVLVAFVAFAIISDIPETAKFLTEEERQWVMSRLSYSGKSTESTEAEKFKWDYIKAGVTDWQVWLSIFVAWGATCVVYGISFFLPTIVRRLGFTANAANLLTIPMYTCAAIATVTTTWFSDRVGKRHNFLISWQCVVVLGFVMSIAGSAKGGITGLQFAGVFLVTLGVYPSYIMQLTWISGNIAPTYKRGTALGLQIGMGNMGGAMASNFYRDQDAPGFVLGHSVELGFVVMGITAGFIMKFMYKRINKAREEMVDHEQQYTDAELDVLGDRAPTFRYRL
ncbi:major facilitator superfamily transporter [Stagonosporopsis vannaccii]|nr:major facilitator superfamily transporter [Stagonosporopsis vannaccii]